MQEKSRINKFSSFLHTETGHFLFGLLIALLGFFISFKMQKPNDSIWGILSFTILYYFLGDMIANKFFALKNENKDVTINTDDIKNSITDSFTQLKKEVADRNSNLFDIDITEDFIVSFLGHLSDECFSKCSNVSAKCSTCDKFPDNCDGLLRNYLFHEVSDLRKAIHDSRKGEYVLATNIEKYHTIAIEHLIVSKSKHYKVIQCIGSDELKSATYDRLDFHFLNSLLSKITEIEAAENIPYYKKQKFNIKWFLIGDIEKIKNNFDYIFYVIKILGLQDNVKKFFDFYTMTEDNYKANGDPLIATDNDFIKRMVGIDKKYYKPSFGIFGSNFIFEDASDVNQHGTIYTKMYRPYGDSSTENLVDILNKFFDKILHKAKKITIDELFVKYNNIINNDSLWEKKLEKIWYPEKPSL
jgi:hypothetical protein